MSRQQLFAGFFFAAFLYLLYQSYQVFSFFAVPLGWATLLALMFYPVNGWLVRRLHHREGLAAFLLTTLVILIVMVPTFYLSLRLANESVAFVQRTNEAIESGRILEAVQQLRVSPVVRLWERMAPHLQTWNIDPASLLLAGSEAIRGFLVAQATAAAANILRFLADFFLTTFALFFFFRDGERMVRGLRAVIPMEPADKDIILHRFDDTVSAVVQGTLVTGIIQGVLSGLGFWVMGVSFANLLGVASALLSLIPFGAPVLWIAVVISLAIKAEWMRAVILAAWGIVVIAAADNFIRPAIIGGRAKIPTVFLFFGILGGLQAYGFLGIFLGPLLIAILVAFLRIYREQYATE